MSPAGSADDPRRDGIAAPWEAFRGPLQLDGFDEAFACLMWRLAGPAPPFSLAPAVCALGRGLARGQGCIRLAGLAGRPWFETDTGPGPELPPLGRWREELLGTAVIGPPGDERHPMILDDRDRLYLYRYWHYERELALGLRRRTRPLRPIPAGLGKALDALFAPGPGMDAARLAAVLAALKPLCIISGGPGTGKTVTAVRILALLLRLAVTAPSRLALAAPTGKAAMRLQAAVQSALGRLPGPHVLPALPAVTLHRLLGARRDGGFRYGPKRALPLDALVVDEASMIDLALMWRLEQALPPDARLILVGDRDQLASVEPGAVFHELCTPSPARSAALGHALRQLGVAEPRSRITAGDEPAPLGDCTAILAHNFRFAAGSGIAALASAVCRGDVEAVRAILGAPPPDLGFHAMVDTAPRLPAGFDVKALYRPARDRQAALDCMRRFRILAVQREGPWGVQSLNARVRKRLGAVGIWYPGRQLLVLENRPALDLYNGDLGIVLAHEEAARSAGEGDGIDPAPPPLPEESGGAPAGPDSHCGAPFSPGAGALRVVFPSAGSGPRELPPHRLPGHEDAYAMTVHKSQGSEFDRVLLVLPPRPDLPLLTRRLLYTAITRARRRVDLWASMDTVLAAVQREEPRVSGLGERLALGEDEGAAPA